MKIKAAFVILATLSLVAGADIVVVYDNQIPVVGNGRVNDPHYPVYLRHADSFILSNAAVINQASWLGAYKNGLHAASNDNFTLQFFAFDGATPATTPLASIHIGAAERNLTPQVLSSGVSVFSYLAGFPDLPLTAGQYLISIVNDPVHDDRWLWADADYTDHGHSWLRFSDSQGWWEYAGGGVAEFAFSLLYRRDTTPPLITNIVASQSALWPPNHKMFPVELSVAVADDSDSTPAVRIVEVRSNEPNGSVEPDWKITGPLTVSLRVARAGKGDDRIYTIVVEAADSSGNVSFASVDVRVAHDSRISSSQ
jgi:hypothetical protein